MFLPWAGRRACLTSSSSCRRMQATMKMMTKSNKSKLKKLRKLKKGLKMRLKMRLKMGMGLGRELVPSRRQSGRGKERMLWLWLSRCRACLDTGRGCGWMAFPGE